MQVDKRRIEIRSSEFYPRLLELNCAINTAGQSLAASESVKDRHKVAQCCQMQSGF